MTLKETRVLSGLCCSFLKLYLSVKCLFLSPKFHFVRLVIYLTVGFLKTLNLPKGGKKSWHSKIKFPVFPSQVLQMKLRGAAPLEWLAWSCLCFHQHGSHWTSQHIRMLWFWLETYLQVRQDEKSRIVLIFLPLGLEGLYLTLFWLYTMKNLQD